ncbi:MAG: hypothetical protein C5B52_08225 [Bacteroidetes bacterium]|nr:MAG: hypothetical protein C5B52_08225 [Bacteroidota bacterium]
MKEEPKKDIYDYLMNATKVEFFTPEKNDGVAAVYIIFEDMRIASALYPEVIRVNNIKEQYFKFKKSHSSLIVSFVLKDENREHATCFWIMMKNNLKSL